MRSQGSWNLEMLLGRKDCICEEPLPIPEGACLSIDWRWTTPTELNIIPSGWNANGSWVTDESGEIHQYVPDDQYPGGTVLKLPGVKFEPIEFVNDQTFNGANSYYNQPFADYALHPTTTLAHDVPYYPMWSDWFVNTPPFVGFGYYVAGADHICRTEAKINRLLNFYVPVNGVEIDDSYTPSQHDQVLWGGGRNRTRIKMIRMIKDGAPHGGYVTIDGQYQKFYRFGLGDDTWRHNVVVVHPVAGFNPNVSLIDWDGLQGAAIGIEVFLEVSVGWQLAVFGPGPFTFSHYVNQPYPWIHDKPTQDPEDPIVEASGALGWSGTINEDFDPSIHTYQFTSLEGPTFPITATAGEESADVIEPCRIFIERVSTIEEQDFEWSLEMKWGSSFPFIDPQHPISDPASLRPYLILEVPSEVSEPVFLNKILYVPEDSTAAPHTYRNTRDPDPDTFRHWQNLPGPWNYDGATVFVPAHKPQINETGAFLPFEFINLPERIQVTRVNQ
jgi:hypothetical protein